MALLTYDDLKAAVANWINREDLISVIPDFITLAESRIARTLRVSDMEVASQATLVDGSVDLPLDWIEARRIVGDGAYDRPLQFVTPEHAGNTWFGASGGVPGYYSISGSTLTTYPNGGTGGVTMIYYAKPPALGVAQPNNWLLLKAPEIYLYGSLVESAPFLGDDARLDTWGKMFKTACDNLQASDDRGRYGSSVTRVRGYTP